MEVKVVYEYNVCDCGIAKKTIFARQTPEETCRLRIGCWCRNIGTAALSLAYLTAEYCAPVCCRSVHNRFIDMHIAFAWRIGYVLAHLFGRGCLGMAFSALADLAPVYLAITFLALLALVIPPFGN